MLYYDLSEVSLRNPDMAAIKFHETLEINKNLHIMKISLFTVSQV